MVVARILKAAGLSFADIIGVPLTPADGRAAFDQGAIDAWAIYGYSVPITISASAGTFSGWDTQSASSTRWPRNRPAN